MFNLPCDCRSCEKPHPWMREMLTQYWLPAGASRPLRKTCSDIVRIQHLVSVDAVRHGRCPTRSVWLTVHVEPNHPIGFRCGTPLCWIAFPLPTLKLNSRVRSRHIIVPPPLVCNNMNADGPSRDRSYCLLLYSTMNPLD
jgi:hypothetical protein